MDKGWVDELPEPKTAEETYVAKDGGRDLRRQRRRGLRGIHHREDTQFEQRQGRAND
jgi:hypothetical protein